MAEPLNLAPVRVHAVSVPVRRPPDSIAGPDEMMLQLGENGGVQVDLFGRDAQGNELHETREMKEDEYEEMRARYMRAEQATMPPFNSFKSGNTIGRVVGETAPAAVPASQANPPIEAETEGEQSWWKSASPWVHGGLDALGFVPGLGAIPDLINAGIYAAEGDAVNASLSAVAAIPLAGDAIKGGVLIGKGAHHLGAEAAQQATQRAAKEATEKTVKETAEREAKEQTARQTSVKAQDGAKVQPKKLTTYTKNGYKYHLDDKGRVVKVEGTLKLNKSQTRNPKAQRNAGGKDRLPDDQGGHFVGRRFDGPTDEMNHFAQNGDFNNSAYRKLENSWERMLKDKKDVRIEITPRYADNSLRPDKVTVKQWIDGIPQRPISYGNNLGGTL